jgi:hypothetical protein
VEEVAVVTFLWGRKYNVEYVERLAASVRRNLTTPHRFLCLTEREREVQFSNGIERHAIKDPELLSEKGCFVRLRLIDAGWQSNRRIGNRLLSIDLDNVIVGSLDHLLDRHEELVILQGVNSQNPCPYNGSIFSLQAHTYQHVWQDFSLEKAYQLPYFDFPDDQGWLWHVAPHAGAYTPKDDGVYAFQKPGWPKGEDSTLPNNACVVAFPGWRDPSKFMHLPWVLKHWRT